MGKWIEQEGSPRFVETRGGGARLIRRFKAEKDEGREEATNRGYTIGQGLTYQTDGSTDSYYLEIASIEPTNATAYDLVTITWQTPHRSVSARNQSPYMDGRTRTANEEEWRLEAETDTKAAEDSYDKDGNAWSESWGIAADSPMLQPGAILIGRKWLNKNTVTDASAPPVTLPTSQSAALDMAETYLPGAGGSYESSGPRIMHRLDGSGLGAKFLCVSIATEADGDLVLRTARYKYKPVAWDATLYG